MKRSGLLTMVIGSSLLVCSFLIPGTQEVHTSGKQVLWSRLDSSYNNFRIPSLILTTNGTVLAFAEGREGGDSGDIDLLCKRSVDGGLSWSEPIVVWNDGGNTCGNPCPVVDQASGRIILFMTWNLGSDHEDLIIRKQSWQWTKGISGKFHMFVT